MSQQDFDITTADANTGLTMRAAINAALQALASNNAGATAPGTTYPFQSWADTTSGFMKVRNAANNGWIPLFPLAVAFSAVNVTNAPVLRDSDGDVHAASAIGGNNLSLDNLLADNAQIQAFANQGYVPALSLTEGNVLAIALYKAVGSTDGTVRFRTNLGVDGKFWTDINDGAGSGLDADLVRGQRIIRGTFTTNNTGPPSIISGAGFTVARSGVGIYTITFTNTFSDIYTIIASGGVSVGGYYVNALRVSNSTASILAVDSSHAYYDSSGGAIGFIAIGPN